MHILTESILAGKWKSFKTFKHTGDIQLHTYNKYKEFEFSDNRQLTIKTHKEGSTEKETPKDQWKVHFENKKYYLLIPGLNLRFEILTVNHTVLVLQHTVSQDKIFFARQQHWEAYLKSNGELIL